LIKKLKTRNENKKKIVAIMWFIINPKEKLITSYFKIT
jgi:hypothetical protein